MWTRSSPSSRPTLQGGRLHDGTGVNVTRALESRPEPKAGEGIHAPRDMSSCAHTRRRPPLPVPVRGGGHSSAKTGGKHPRSPDDASGAIRYTVRSYERGND